MPTPPEPKRRVIVGHAAHHILGRVNAVEKGPEAEETPGNEELWLGGVGGEESWWVGERGWREERRRGDAPKRRRAREREVSVTSSFNRAQREE